MEFLISFYSKNGEKIYHEICCDSAKGNIEEWAEYISEHIKAKFFSITK